MHAPDWKDAPEWAQYLARDADGVFCWFEYMPQATDGVNGFWFVTQGRLKEATAPSRQHWTETIVKRP
jgi:hypothetical protein